MLKAGIVGRSREGDGKWFNLGCTYTEGTDVAKDTAKALRLPGRLPPAVPPQDTIFEKIREVTRNRHN